MELITTDPDPEYSEGYSNTKRREDGLWIGILPVIFGFRVIVWDEDNPLFYACSLCGGASSGKLAVLYGLVHHYLESVEPDKKRAFKTLELLQHIEGSHRRPWGEDDLFRLKATDVLTGQVNLLEDERRH